MASDDFTFPIVSDAVPRFLDSPPLWRSSSTANKSEQRPEDAFPAPDRPRSRRRKSFPGAVGNDVDDDDDEEEEEEEEEERMDMLWEDFNEELHDKYCCSSEETEETVRVRCVPAMAGTTAGGTVVAARRAASLLMFVKMLRKLFQLHHSHPNSHHKSPLSL